MSKQMRLTAEQVEEFRQQVLKEFDSAVPGSTSLNGRFSTSYTYTPKVSDRRATVAMTPTAFAKTILLVSGFSSEAAWHGIAKRDPNVPDKYLITDVLVYPQEVTGTTVDTDQVAYQNWLMSQPDEVYNNLRMQAHSHVNMSVSPSGRDESDQKRLVEKMKEDSFYIFMIWNKRLEHYIVVYDMAANLLFERGDVDFTIEENGVDFRGFVKDSSDLVKTRTYSYQSNGASAQSPASSVTATGAAAPKISNVKADSSQKSYSSVKPFPTVDPYTDAAIYRGYYDYD